LVKFLDPAPGWANPTDCGNFPCTGPHNLLLEFKRTSYSGTVQPLTGADFELIPNNTGFTPFITDCTAEPLWNGYFCDKPSLGILLFESQDSDSFDRSMQPVYTEL